MLRIASSPKGGAFGISGNFSQNAKVVTIVKWRALR